MEENTTGLGDGRDDEIDFTFDDHEEETGSNMPAHDQQTEVTATAENAADPNVNDNEGLDDVLYDEDDDEDDENRPGRDEQSLKLSEIVADELVDDIQYDAGDQQEHDNEDEIDYEDEPQPQIAHGGLHESDYGEQQQLGSRHQVEDANDGFGSEERPGDFDYGIGKAEQEHAHSEYENNELGDYEAEAEDDDIAGEYAEESAADDSEPANAGPRGSNGDVHQITRDLDWDLGEYQNSTPHVEVTWGDDTCTLFKSSDDADPSSYYLDDIEALNYPLTKFLASMRTNIAQWVNDKDEIHVSVDQLGIEFCETTTPALIEQVTFQHLIALHEKLVRNDGDETFQALHLTLTTKTNCALRLGELIQAANAGQGLAAIYSGSTSNASSEHDNYLDNGSYDDYRVGGYHDDMGDDMGDDSQTMNTGRDESHHNSAGTSPHAGSNVDPARASDAGVATLPAETDETSDENRTDQVSTGVEDVIGSDLNQNDMIDYEAYPAAIDVVAATLDPIIEDQLDLIEYSNDIVAHGDGEITAAEDLLTEMSSFDPAIGEADNGNGLVTQDGETSTLDAALASSLGMENDADLVDFGNDLSGDGQQLLSLNAVDSNLQLDTANEIPSIDATHDAASEAFQLGASHADDEYLEMGADVATDPLAVGFEDSATGVTTQVTHEEQQRNPSNHSAGLEAVTTSLGENSNGDCAGVVAGGDVTAVPDKPAKDVDVDEIDWDDEDKVTVPITPTSATATPNTTGKRTRDADEADDLVDSGHDFKRHRSDQLQS